MLIFIVIVMRVIIIKFFSITPHLALIIALLASLEMRMSISFWRDLFLWHLFLLSWLFYSFILVSGCVTAFLPSNNWMEPNIWCRANILLTTNKNLFYHHFLKPKTASEILRFSENYPPRIKESRIKIHTCQN